MRLLLVEDDVKLAQAVCRGLRGEGYAVDHAADGEAAIADANVWDYDAVILDLMLPRRDGFEVCRTLRRRGNGVPILMLTARDLVDDPARHVVTRSGTPVELTAREFSVLEYLARHPGELISRARLLDHVW